MAVLAKGLQRYRWTRHVQDKMRYYRLSESRVLRVVRHPARMEKGIAPKTVAVMQPVGTTRKPHEIWVMYQDRKDTRHIITAWRYPGRSPIREAIPIPKDILIELENALQEK